MPMDPHELNSPAFDRRSAIPDIGREADMRRLLEDGLRRLTEEQRAALTLRYMYGASPRQVADAQCITQNNAERRIERALTRLRKYYDSTEKGDDALEALTSRPYVVPLALGLARPVMEAVGDRAPGSRERGRMAEAVAFPFATVGVAVSYVLLFAVSGAHEARVHSRLGDRVAARAAASGMGSAGRWRVELSPVSAARWVDPSPGAVVGEAEGGLNQGGVGRWTRGALGGGVLAAALRDGNLEVVMMDADGDDERNLTRHPAKDEQPAWMPDGRGFVFTADRGDSGRDDVWLQDTITGDLHLVTDGKGANILPAPSPDGSSILFVSDRTGEQKLYTVAPDGSGLRQLTFGVGREHFPAWSPDGTKILYQSNRRRVGAQDHDDLYVMDAKGGPAMNLTQTWWNDHHGTWSPDGKSIVFHSYRDRNDEIYVMRADGANRRRLTRNDAADIAAAFSPDGAWIHFLSGRTGRFTMYRIRPDGTGEERVARGTDISGRVSWPPGPPWPYPTRAEPSTGPSVLP